MRQTPITKQIIIRPGQTAVVDLEGSTVFRLRNINTDHVIKGYAHDFSNNGQSVDDMVIGKNYNGKEIRLIRAGQNPDSVFRQVRFTAPGAKEDVLFTLDIL